MLQLADFAPHEFFSYTSIFKTLVLSFYFNMLGLWCKRKCCTERKIVVSLQCLLVVAH